VWWCGAPASTSKHRRLFFQANASTFNPPRPVPRQSTSLRLRLRKAGRRDLRCFCSSAAQRTPGFLTLRYRSGHLPLVGTISALPRFVMLTAPPRCPSTFAKDYGGQVDGRDSFKELPAPIWAALPKSAGPRQRRDCPAIAQLPNRSNLSTAEGFRTAYESQGLSGCE